MGTTQAPVATAAPVTVDNFIRAESDLYFRNVVKEGGLGKFAHRREPAAIDKQTVIRLNRGVHPREALSSSTGSRS